MSSLFENDDIRTMITCPCDECGRKFEEYRGVAVFKVNHPATRLLCISCDPKADAPALLHVTLKGWAQAG